MDAPTLRAIFLAGTIGLIFFLLWFDRENVERAGVLFFRRTEKGIDMIDRIAKKFPRFWNVYSWSGVVAALVSIVLITGFMGLSVFEVASTGNPSKDFGLVAPGTGSSVSAQPGVTFVPAEYWFISIAILMFVHELSHGIVARTVGFEINSVGALVLAVIPGAFVEPKGENMLPGGDSESSEEEMESEDSDGSEEHHGAWDQGNWISRIKVLSAGSFANYVFAVVFLIAATLTTQMIFDPGEIHYTAQEGFPAAESGMDSGVIKAVNGSDVGNFTSFAEGLSGIQVNDTTRFNTTEGVFDVKATSSEEFSGGHLGIRFSAYTGFQNWFISLLMVISFLNLGIGMFNMLPAKPLDGGHILDAVAERLFGEKAVRYVNAWSLFVILALVLTLGYSIVASM